MVEMESVACETAVVGKDSVCAAAVKMGECSTDNAVVLHYD